MPDNHTTPNILRALSAGLLAAAALAAIAQTAPVAPVASVATAAVGYVKTVTGEAWVSTEGQRAKAALGTPVMIGSQLKTLAGASLGVTFKDNTTMSFGPDTELTVDEYLYAPAQGQMRLGTSLVKGSLNYVSGVIAKLKPEAVTVKTPTGIIGVRGTQFVAKVEDTQ
jgi:hypothetical protein